MKKGEIVFSAVCVAFFGFMFYEGLDLAGQGRPGEIGSGLWPLLAIGASALFSVALLVSSVMKLRREGAAENLTPEAAAEKRRQRLTVTLSVVCFLVYMGAIPFLGFILSTLVYIPAFALALGERRIWVLFVSPFLLTAVIVAVFAKFITIPFPKGVGIFAEFSRLFY
ncbi:MAG: tripartite tricarboxylate transporter TctB family protein [Desulfobacterales bacterium]|jgi:putative tricarboxylic transport membrane protein|nr:tripartite tricarboxylate transporter TctB family protein [Desulfobacterales bacterium]MCU0585857.1 tripartite tricarboxylate transporter TctB family protein [Desulfobacterales bacterium]